MKEKFPGITVFEQPTDWEGAKASAALQTRLAQHPDINGIYMQAGGVFLPPTLQLLQQKNLLMPPGDPKHISIISNDGIPQEFDAIRKGQIDATVSQPADLYAKYALFYAKAARRRARPSSPARPTTTAPSSSSRTAPGGPAARAAGHQGQRRRPTLWGNQSRQVDDRRTTSRLRDGGPAGGRPSASASASAPPPRCDDVGIAVAPGRDPRPGRPQRRRQVDARVDPDRAAARPTRARCASTASRRPPLGRPGRLARARRLRLPALHDHPDAHRSPRTCSSTGRTERPADPLAAAAPAGRGAARRVRRGRRPRRPRRGPRASSSGSWSRSRGRCRSAPGSSSSTSRPPSSTRPAIERLFARLRALSATGRDDAVHLPPPAGGVRGLRHRHRVARRAAHPDRARRRPSTTTHWSRR